jgi:imidazolonepropionase-like amidohydrolase
LSAFGAGQIAKENLQQLQAAGARVLYGTDLGNSTAPSIQRAELSALLDAGMTPQQIVASGTRTAATFWGLEQLGELAPKHEASILVLDEAPYANVLTLSEPEIVIHRGVQVK